TPIVDAAVVADDAEPGRALAVNGFDEHHRVSRQPETAYRDRRPVGDVGDGLRGRGPCLVDHEHAPSQRMTSGSRWRPPAAKPSLAMWEAFPVVSTLWNSRPWCPARRPSPEPLPSCGW